MTKVICNFCKFTEDKEIELISRKADPHPLICPECGHHSDLDGTQVWSNG